MSNPIDTPGQLVRVELAGAAVVEAASGDPAMVAVRLSAARAHSLAHLLGDWTTGFRMTPDRGEARSTFTLSRALEDVAAAVGDPGAMACAMRAPGSVTREQRMAAVAVLREEEPTLSPVQRIAAVDAAARWMDEDAGDEMAYALLGAVCLSDTVTTRTYLALITPGQAGPDAGNR
jgi:hypothetical protein